VQATGDELYCVIDGRDGRLVGRSRLDAVQRRIAQHVVQEHCYLMPAAAAAVAGGGAGGVPMYDDLHTPVVFTNRFVSRRFVP